jgi:hypothetical protein
MHNNKCLFRSNGEGCCCKTNYTDSEKSDIMALGDGKLYYVLAVLSHSAEFGNF